MSFRGKESCRKAFPDNAVSYYFSDHLKTASVITDSAGNIKAESDYYPWGGELQFTNNDSNHYKFSGKERDTETGLDYFGARYYSNGLGRFVTPDWAAKAQPIPYDPQTFDLYSYVRNNALSRIDPDGHYECSGSKAQCGAIKNALAGAKKADANLKAGSTGKAMLDKVLKFYGDEGKANGVKINFNATDPGSLGNTSTANGVTTISFGSDTFKDMQEPGKGETIAHEGTHGVDQQKHGMPRTFWQFYDTEYHAYQAESAVDKGLGKANETDTYPAWSPGITPEQRTTNIKRDAYSNACYDVGGCQ